MNQWAGIVFPIYFMGAVCSTFMVSFMNQANVFDGPVKDSPWRWVLYGGLVVFWPILLVIVLMALLAN